MASDDDDFNDGRTIDRFFWRAYSQHLNVWQQGLKKERLLERTFSFFPRRTPAIVPDLRMRNENMSHQQNRDLILQLYRRRGVRRGDVYPPKALWLTSWKEGMSQSGFKEAVNSLIDDEIIDQDCRLLRSLD